MASLSLTASLLVAVCLDGPISASAQPSGLVGYWTFEEGAGATTADQSGNGFNGTFDNVATWGGPAWTNSPLGRSALNFDGVNDRVVIGNPPALQLTGPITLSAWVYVRQFNPNNGRIITKGGGSGQRGWALNVEGSGTPPNCGSFQIAGSPTATLGIRTATSIPSNRWIHLAGVYVPGTAVRIYTNGSLNNELTASVPATQNNSSLNVAIGGRPTGGVDTPWNGLIDEVRVFNRALSDEEIRALPELVQTPLTFVTQPVNRIVAELRPVTFTAAVRGSPPYFFQWLSNGVPIEGATEASYTIPSTLLDMSGSIFTLTVSNLAYSLTSSNAVLTVVRDTNPPVLLSAGSPDGLTVGLCFSEPVDLGTASDSFNYQINDGTVSVQTAVVRAEGRSVLLTLSPPYLAGNAFTVKVSYVQDLVGNSIPFESTVNGTVAGFAASDLGVPAQPGSTFSCRAGEFDLTASGADIWGAADQGHAALKSIAGDFDVRVRVTDLTPVNSTAKAGLMAREAVDAGSPTLHLLANPPPPNGRGWIEGGLRATAGAGTATWGTPFTSARLPNVWLRLRRVGEVFTGFYSANGADWVILAQSTLRFADLLWVGLAATAHNNSAPATVAEFEGFGDVTFSNPSLSITQPPANAEAAQNSMVTFTAQAEGTGAPVGEMVYQWQRSDGGGGFTNLFGANAPTLTFLVRPDDQGAQFRVRVYFAGLVADSSVATLTVSPDLTPPGIQTVIARGIPTQMTIRFSEAVEADTANDAAHYAITNRNSGLPIGVSAAVLAPDGVTVTLTIEPLTEAQPYTLAARGIQDLGVPPNTIASDAQVPFIFSSLVGHWPFEEGSGTTTADATGAGATGTLLNGPTWAPGWLGQGALEFDGGNDRVDVGNGPLFQITGPITLAAWVYVDTIDDNGRIVTKGGASGQRGWSLNVENIDAWAFQVAASATANLSINVTNILTRTWLHVAGVYDPAVPVMRCYTNGVLGGERTEGVPASQFNSPLNVSIGARPNNQTWFDGKIDEVRIYARALSDGEIADLAKPPVVPPEFLPPSVSAGKITLRWTGPGVLEWATALSGPWTQVTPAPASPFTEDVVSGSRFYRLNANP